MSEKMTRFVVRQVVGAQADFWFVRDRRTGAETQRHYEVTAAMQIAEWLESRAEGYILTRAAEQRILSS